MTTAPSFHLPGATESRLCSLYMWSRPPTNLKRISAFPRASIRRDSVAVIRAMSRCVLSRKYTAFLSPVCQSVRNPLQFPARRRNAPPPASPLPSLLPCRLRAFLGLLRPPPLAGVPSPQGPQRRIGNPHRISGLPFSLPSVLSTGRQSVKKQGSRPLAELPQHA